MSNKSIAFTSVRGRHDEDNDLERIEAEEELAFEKRQKERQHEKQRLLRMLAEQEMATGLKRPRQDARGSGSDSASSSSSSESCDSESEDDKKKKRKKKTKAKSKKRKTDKKKKKKKKSSSSGKKSKKKSSKRSRKEDLDVNQARQKAGLNWMDSEPATGMMESDGGPILSEVAPKASSSSSASSRIDEEVKQGLRDPVSKRHYGFYDPKSMKMEDKLEMNDSSDKQQERQMVRISLKELQKEKNKLAAKAMRAKLSGDTKCYEEIQREIDELTKIETSATPKDSDLDVAVIAPLDYRGNLLRSLVESQSAEQAPVDTRSRQAGLYREKEFEKLEKDMTVEELARREKLSSGMDETFLKNLKGRHAKKLKYDMERGAGNEDFEDTNERNMIDMFVSSKRERMSESRGRQHDLQTAIQAHQKTEKAEAKCPFSFKNPRFRKELVMHVGQHCYIMLASQPIADGHCRIIPLEPIAAYSQANKALEDEVLQFKYLLETMFDAGDAKSLVYLETVLDPKRLGWHTCIDCIPLSDEQAGLVPIYFKKALLEAGDEWAGNHHKLMDTSNKRISDQIHADFPYFHVEWGGRTQGQTRNGYAHIIEDRTKYSKNFGPDIVHALLGQDKLTKTQLSKQQIDQFKQDWSYFS